MIDIHSHLLYGVDDGADTIEESLEMLKDAKMQGIHTIFLTPHYRHGMFSYPQELIRTHIQELKKYAQQIGIQIYLGTEYHVNSHMLENLKAGRCDTLGNSNYVLVEYKQDSEFSFMKSSLQELLFHGYIPIVAHVERYVCMCKNMKNVDTVIDMGVLLQVNADAVLGLQGLRMKRHTKNLLKNRYVSFVASDSHGVKERKNNLGKCREYLLKKYDEDYVDEILEKNAMAILEAVGK